MERPKVPTQVAQEVLKPFSHVISVGCTRPENCSERGDKLGGTAATQAQEHKVQTTEDEIAVKEAPCHHVQ